MMCVLIKNEYNLLQELNHAFIAWNSVTVRSDISHCYIAHLWWYLLNVLLKMRIYHELSSINVFELQIVQANRCYKHNCCSPFERMNVLSTACFCIDWEHACNYLS